MVDKCSECTVTISCLSTFKKDASRNQTKTKRIINDRMPYFTAATSNRQKLDGCSKPIYQYLTWPFYFQGSPWILDATFAIRSFVDMIILSGTER